MSLTWHSSSPSLQRPHGPGPARSRQAGPVGLPPRSPGSQERVGRATPQVFLPPLIIAFLLLSALGLFVLAAMVVTEPISAPSPVPREQMSTSSSRPVEATTLIHSTRMVPPVAAGTIDLVRMTIGPKSGKIGPLASGVLLLALESGSLSVDLDGTASLLTVNRPPEQAQGRVLLQGGDGLALPSGTSVTMENADPEPAVSLAVGIFPEEIASAPVGIDQSQGQPVAARWATAIAPDVTLVPLATGWWGGMPAGPVDVALWRSQVAPQAQTAFTVDGEAMVAIETGAASLRLESGVGWQQGADQADTPIMVMRPARILPGEAGILLGPASVSVVNPGSGPLLYLTLSVRPAEDVSTPEAAVSDCLLEWRSCTGSAGSPATVES